MDKRIAELNIEHLRKKLVEETDPKVREMMQRLLEEERTKLMNLTRNVGAVQRSG